MFKDNVIPTQTASSFFFIVSHLKVVIITFLNFLIVCYVDNCIHYSSHIVSFRV